RESLFDFRLQRVVVRRGSVLEDVEERTERQVLRVQVGYRLQDRVALHRRERLILVGQVRQVRGCRPNIREFDDQVGNQFVLYTQTPLLNARSFQVGFDDEHRGLNDRLGGVGKDLIDNRKLTLANEFRRPRGV